MGENDSREYLEAQYQQKVVDSEVLSRIEIFINNAQKAGKTPEIILREICEKVQGSAGEKVSIGTKRDVLAQDPFDHFALDGKIYQLFKKDGGYLIVPVNEK